MDQDSDNQVIRPCQFPALPSWLPFFLPTIVT
jgi:hypothetical protein